MLHDLPSTCTHYLQTNTDLNSFWPSGERRTIQSLELLKEKKEEISKGGEWGGGGGPVACSPGKILKVETKICANGGILEANLKKSKP